MAPPRGGGDGVVTPYTLPVPMEGYTTMVQGTSPYGVSCPEGWLEGVLPGAQQGYYPVGIRSMAPHMGWSRDPVDHREGSPN